MAWRVRGFLGDVEIELFPSSPLDADAQKVSDRELALLLHDFTHRDPKVRRVVLEIYAQLQGLPGGAWRGEASGLDVGPSRAAAIAMELRQAARSGSLVARRREARAVVLPSEDGPEEDALGPAPESAPDPTAWIALRTVYESGDPLPGVAYSIVCPDGSTRTGTTDADGRARETGLTPGSCKVTLPELADPVAPGSIELAPGSRVPSPAPTDNVYEIALRQKLYLLRLYHDDAPVQIAPFALELMNGQKLEGKLDTHGEAWMSLPGPAKQVQYEPDGRDWARVDQTKNPDFQDDIDPDSFVAARFAGDPAPASAAASSPASGGVPS